MSEYRASLAVFEWILPFLTLGLFCAGFGLPNWVVTDADLRKYGLWNNCTTNSALMEESKAQGKDVQECESIPPGKSDSYFEAVRVVSCLALLFHAVVVFTLFRDRNKKNCEGYTPAMLGFIGVALTGGVVGVVIENYKDDSHWRDMDPRLDISVWLEIAAAVGGFITACLLCRRGAHEKEMAAKAYREEQDRKKGQLELKLQRRMAEETSGRGGALGSGRGGAGAGGAGATQERSESTATLTGALKSTVMLEKLRSNRVAPSAPRRPASGHEAGDRPESRHSVRGYVSHRERTRPASAASSTFSDSSTSLSVNSADDVVLPPCYTEASGFDPLSPSIVPPQTPLPWLTVPDPVGPPPAYDEVMINPDYYQPPYHQAVGVWEREDYTPPPRPATADYGVCQGSQTLTHW